MGRPAKIVDEKRMIELASKGYTVKEIAALENVSESHLYSKYLESLRKGRLLCAASIRRKQYELAMAGNVTLLI